MKKEEVQQIITDYIDSVEIEFNDWLCYEKYGVEEFTSKGFYPTDEDFRIRNQIHLKILEEAIYTIKNLGDSVIPLLDEIIMENTNIEVRNWAKIILEKMI